MNAAWNLWKPMGIFGPMHRSFSFFNEQKIEFEAVGQIVILRPFT